MEQSEPRARRAAGERNGTRPGSRLPFDDGFVMGVIFYVLIVATIVLASDAQYRFFYGSF
ncbi:MAG TPA: hypothetical protein VFB22_13105 [Candidatus Baltobacteraceae bacterium]|nr:hypothetical protein [Candidatus Baltobacteraceae bacterium]